jgi:hypothetical protein
MKLDMTTGRLGRRSGIDKGFRSEPTIRILWAGHEFQHQAPACWAATLLRGGVPRVMTRPARNRVGKRGP